ncbi:MAG: dipeptide epimerase [Bacteroidetes bacterium]|nr:dipeptide epimerase [Bacteroidota bacterium]MCL5738582.1 dipeptide epimerase [Bacteroidota bacterium]
MERRKFMYLAGASVAMAKVNPVFSLGSISSKGKGKMNFEYWRYDLKLKHTFTISRSSRDSVPVMLMKFEKDGITAYGEASPNARYNEAPNTVEAFFKKVDIAKLSDPFKLEDINDYLDSIAPGNTSAKAAVDIAMHDWIGKKLGIPLYKFFGVDKSKTPISTFTIGIDTPDVIEQKVREAANYPILKIKVGLPNDEEIIKAVRSVTNKPLRVDANEGWKSKEEALERINWLATQNVEFIEQPMPASQIDDIRWLHERVKMPIIADEAIESLYDIAEVATAYDGINVKVQKIGGLTKSRKLIYAARAHKMKIMTGCMIESSIGITSAVQISPLTDWTDLDGNVLINNDPFVGAENIDGKLLLNDEPGLGVLPRS